MPDTKELTLVEELKSDADFLASLTHHNNALSARIRAAAEGGAK